MQSTEFWPGITPVVTPESEAFWHGANEGVFTTDFCEACSRYVFPPRGVCPTCLSDDVADRDVAREGVVHSYTTNHNQWWPEQAVPMTFALIELDAHVRVLAQMRSTTPIEVGSAVEIAFESVAPGLSIPVFHVAPPAGSSS